MSLAVLHPWLLALLPLCVVPLLWHSYTVMAHPWLDLVPGDRLSLWLERVLRTIGALLVGTLILGLAGLHRPEYEVERIGRGAHMVLLVDRSRSMDQPFGEGYQRNVPGLVGSRVRSKGRVARQLLSEFVARRRNDLFGMVAFSTFPIPILELTGNHDIVQAAIEAGNVGRGLSETDIGTGLERALAYFEDIPYTGSRIVVLVSDGAAELSQSTRLRIINMMNRLRVSLYWIYIRSAHGPRIFDDPRPGKGEDLAPERLLHAFFSDMGAPYKAYTAASPEALQQAISDVAVLQNLPLRYHELVPRRDLSRICYVLALGLVAILVLARLAELEAMVRPAPVAMIAPRRRNVTRLSGAILVALVLLLGWLGLEVHALHGARVTNASIIGGALTDLAGEDSPRGRMAQGYIAQSNDRLDEALEAYGQVGALGNSALTRALRFNLGNLYLARAAEFERRGEKRLSISLIEQAKQNYRELLALDPGFWDARYNLSRALEMLPDLADVHYGEEVNPERSPQAPQADTAYERLP